MKMLEATKENKLLKIIKTLVGFTLWMLIYAFILFFFAKGDGLFWQVSLRKGLTIPLRNYS